MEDTDIIKIKEQESHRWRITCTWPMNTTLARVAKEYCANHNIVLITEDYSIGLINHILLMSVFGTEDDITELEYILKKIYD